LQIKQIILRYLTFIFLITNFSWGFSQKTIVGKIEGENINYSNCKVGISGTSKITVPDSAGIFKFSNLNSNDIELQCFCLEFESQKIKIDLSQKKQDSIIFKMKQVISDLEEVAVFGNVKELVRAESPIVTDVYDKKYFIKNPSPNLMDMMDRMNGVRSQVNCNVCGTGDIHLNGLEGPYTLIVLDGVPIVGGLSSVYGLSGIPSFLLDRIEVTKGPASSLYGSEAVAGVIHAYTKKASKKPEFQFQYFASSHREFNTDLGLNLLLGKKTAYFLSANQYFFDNKLDQNKDNFTDVPLQNRFSVFQRFNFERKMNRIFNISMRYMQENRWGGELNWNENFRGGDSIYAESIYLKRGEMNLVYQLPTTEKIVFLTHTNFHLQDSYYGTMKFDASQQLFFSQLTWEKSFQRDSLSKLKSHDFLLGLTKRYTVYDDNTFSTQTNDSLNPQNQILKTFLPGIFWQHNLKFKSNISILYSSRLDYHNEHKFIFTPRIAAMKRFKNNSSFRIHAGTGFRIVNLFTEDHAALTGSRQIIISENLKPERSKSINSSYLWTKKINLNWTFEHDIQAFYTYFSNRIIPDYESNVNQIVYKNSSGYSQSAGLSTDLKLNYKQTFSLQTGITYMDVSQIENGIKTDQILTEHVSGNWTISYSYKKISIDYTGNFVGPMRLPTLGDLDPRPQYSQAYSIQNLQITYKINEKCYFFGGIKNLLNWTPAKNTPFLIARSNDPFDKNVNLDNNGQVLATVDNPFALTFDPAYVYAPNQGIRAFFGFRITFKK
jgi:outer membrane receptor for ferrienterochelin and colicins